MAFGMAENLRGFAHNRPPLVIFMLCLGGFAVVLVTLAYYVKVKELTNPDITEDWNTFLKTFGEMEFCIAGNSSEYLAMTSPSTSGNVGSNTGSRSRREEKVKMNNVTTAGTTMNSDWRGNVSVSVQMAVELQPTFEFLSIPHNVTHLSATVLGHQLGFAGYLGDAELNVTMELPYEWNQTMCQRGTACRKVTILTCVTMYSQAGIFPITRRPVCNSSLETGIEYWAQMVSHRPQDGPDHVRCERRPMVRLQHEIDRTLSVMLTMHDRSVINLHLMHTSYFLFVMVITLFCYALIKGRPVRVVQYTDKVPVHT